MQFRGNLTALYFYFPYSAKCSLGEISSSFIHISPNVAADGYFDALIPFQSLLS